VEASSLAEAFRAAADSAFGGADSAFGGDDSAFGGAVAVACGADSAFGGAAVACQDGSGARPFRGWEASGSHTVRASSDAAAFHGSVA